MRPCTGLTLSLLFINWTNAAFINDFTEERKLHYREKVRSMFYHAYDSYLQHAYPLDELRPLTCQGMDTWGSFSLTLIDALDTLLIMGNQSEFARASQLILQNVNVNANVNVSVFETNIRVVSGLLSAHMLAYRSQNIQLPDGWPCSGPLLDLAELFAQKLLPAFNTETGMPYGTVNLRYGVNHYETPITCTAGVGTFLLEFGTLSRLTGNPHYERVALRALKGLWDARSSIGLVGNHIDVQSGLWTATDAGIGAGVDSYYEYLAKGAILFQRPALMQQFNEFETAINVHLRKEDWFTWVSMTKGQISMAMFQSLEGYWPGVLAMLGRVEDASRVLLTYGQVMRQYGFPPEFYNLPNRESSSHRAGYPLRPEIAESLFYLYKATADPTYLQMGAALVEAIERVAKTSCGYATVRDVNDLSLEDRMESFFLAETTKYLFLLFDEHNFINSDGSTAHIIETTDGSCVVEAGGYVFNTEAHPIDPGILYCCSAKRREDREKLWRFEEGIDLMELIGLKEDTNLGMSIEEETIDDDIEDRGNNTHLHSHHSNPLPPSPIDDHNPFVLIDNDPDSIRAHRPVSDADVNIKSKTAAIMEPTTSNSKKDGIDEELKKILTELGEVVSKSNSNNQATPFICAPNCCLPIEDPSLKQSNSLRAMLTLIYEHHLYPINGETAHRGPICLPSEAPPPYRIRYFNVGPNSDSLLDSEQQRLDAIDRLSFGDFTYSNLANENFTLLTSKAPPFLSAFMGLGQVIPTEK